MCYGQTREEAISNVERLAIEVIADRIAHGELPTSAPLHALVKGAEREVHQDLTLDKCAIDSSVCLPPNKTKPGCARGRRFRRNAT